MEMYLAVLVYTITDLLLFLLLLVSRLLVTAFAVVLPHRNVEYRHHPSDGCCWSLCASPGFQLNELAKSHFVGVNRESSRA